MATVTDLKLFTIATKSSISETIKVQVLSLTNEQNIWNANPNNPKVVLKQVVPIQEKI